MNRCCEAGYDGQEDKRSERLRQRSREFGADQEASPADATAPRRLYAVGSPATRTERSDFTRGR
jgi:hypothetical protein